MGRANLLWFLSTTQFSSMICACAMRIPKSWKATPIALQALMCPKMEISLLLMAWITPYVFGTSDLSLGLATDVCASFEEPHIISRRIYSACDGQPKTHSCQL